MPMLGTIFTLGNLSDATSYVASVFSDTWELFALAVGIPLAFYVIKQVISLVPKGRGTRKS